MSDRDITNDPPNLLQLLLLAFRFAAEGPCRRNTEWCRKRFPCRWKRLLYTKTEKKRCKWLPCKGNSRVWLNWIWILLTTTRFSFCIVCKCCWFVFWLTFELDVSSSCETINAYVNDLFIPMFYINQRVCWNYKESGVGERSLIDAVITYFSVHDSEECRKIQLSSWLPGHSLSG